MGGNLWRFFFVHIPSRRLAILYSTQAHRAYAHIGAHVRLVANSYHNSNIVCSAKHMQTDLQRTASSRDSNSPRRMYTCTTVRYPAHPVSDPVYLCHFLDFTNRHAWNGSMTTYIVDTNPTCLHAVHDDCTTQRRIAWLACPPASLTPLARPPRYCVREDARWSLHGGSRQSGKPQPGVVWQDDQILRPANVPSFPTSSFSAWKGCCCALLSWRDRNGSLA